MGTAFYLQNDGILAIHDVNFMCRIDNIPGYNISNIRLVTNPTKENVLRPGKRVSANCMDTTQIFIPPNAKLDATLVTTYRQDWTWWKKTSEFPMEATNNGAGCVWRNLPEGE
ncbi:hypothetical protein [Candidatus Korobacter versatilis]|uniref:hypothetical protein n=1 Tax=Candidatus Korobacter versatilis TaxID=658062 RepID=UPI0005A46718|nr:hypothetical protein [Candidatus Koribacter versatilis]